MLDTIKMIGKEYDHPVVLDAKAMHTGKLDPLGLTEAVRGEVIMVTPATR